MTDEAIPSAWCTDENEPATFRCRERQHVVVERREFPVPTPENPLRTPAYIAKAMDVKPYTVREWLHAGKLKGYQDENQNWQVLHSDYIAFLQDRFGASAASYLS